MAPAVATGEAGITACLACSRIGATGCARASVGLSAGVRTGILVDAIVIGNPGAIAAACSALCHSLVLRAKATRCCCSQSGERGCDAQAQEHGHEKWRRRDSGRELKFPAAETHKSKIGLRMCLAPLWAALPWKKGWCAHLKRASCCDPEPHTVAAGKLRSIAKAILSAPRSCHSPVDPTVDVLGITAIQ